MTLWARRRSFLVASVLALAAVGCGPAASTGDLDKIQVQVTAFDLIVTNTAGRALMDMKVEILPVGRATSYSSTVARMENGEKRNISLNVFSDRDGVPFSLRNVRPTAISVNAHDLEGKTVRIEVPWKR